MEDKLYRFLHEEIVVTKQVLNGLPRIEPAHLDDTRARGWHEGRLNLMRDMCRELTYNRLIELIDQKAAA